MDVAGLGFAKLSTCVLDLAILRMKGVALAETGAAGLGFAKTKDEEGGDGRGPVVVAHAAVVVVAMHVAMAVAVW